eukprot:COSAG06_NODE_60634_length_270_cov_0.608187_1_plen_37_part_10
MKELRDCNPESVRPASGVRIGARARACLITQADEHAC